MERFTRRAKEVLQFAQASAERFHHGYIGTEHLLLGLVHVESGVAGRALRELSISELKIEALVSEITKAETSLSLVTAELSSGAKRVLELAVDEARRMGHHYIGTEHLLLGLVRLPEGKAIDVLREMGVSPEEVRRQTRRVLQDSISAVNTPEPLFITKQVEIGSGEERFTQRARRILSLAQGEAQRLEQGTVSTGHLLLAMILEKGGVAERVLRDLRVEQKRVEELVSRLNYEKPTSATPQGLDLATATKHVLTFAVDEARRMGRDYIGTEHLLLGLVRLPEGVAIDILREMGVSPQEVRRQTRRVLQEAPVVTRSEESAANFQRVTIGCSPEDRRVAEWLTYGLAAHQFTSWTNSVDASNDKGWDERLTLLLMRSEVLVLVLSPNALVDKQLTKGRIFFEAILERPIVPVQWQDCDIDPALETLGIIDLRGQREEGIAELVAAIKKQLGKADDL
jgi:ATP-dependent Clp protease ATP-binding subunit ClpA